MTRRAPTEAEIADLLFAFRVCKHVKSNAIVYAKDGATVGIGAGQPSRVDSARIGGMEGRGGGKGGRSRRAADARQRGGVRCVLPVRRRTGGRDCRRCDGGHPAGRVAARQGGDRRGGCRRCAMVFTGMRHFRPLKRAVMVRCRGVVAHAPREDAGQVQPVLARAFERDVVARRRRGASRRWPDRSTARARSAAPPPRCRRTRSPCRHAANSPCRRRRRDAATPRSRPRRVFSSAFSSGQSDTASEPSRIASVSRLGEATEPESR